eukprot:1042945-Rhodomonas_salina.1
MSMAMRARLSAWWSALCASCPATTVYVSSDVPTCVCVGQYRKAVGVYRTARRQLCVSTRQLYVSTGHCVGARLVAAVYAMRVASTGHPICSSTHTQAVVPVYAM